MSETQNKTPYFIVNVEAAICKGGKWLMCVRSEKESHAGGMLSLVGGKVEHSDPAKETLEEAVKREVLEETGLSVRPVDYVQSTSFVSKLGNHIVDVVFLCEADEGKETLHAPDELTELRWMTLDEIKKHPKAADWLIASMGMSAQLHSTKAHK
ncbi:MAG: NUDIX domain-containing protein [Patescibacteria group bacterium]|nr:NUDIX domain-containing protein [Patescibacteria group bacterium]